MNKARNGFLSGAALKIIACVSMVIDHFAAIVLWNYLRQSAAAGNQNPWLEDIYHVGRAIGRIAFVLFAYLLAEGFLYTGSRKKFLLRLGAFALISEIPFDLAFSGTCFDWSSQNVFFTLFLGVLALCMWEWADGCAGAFISAICRYGAVALCGLAAYWIKSDYCYTGVFLIFIFYLMHDTGLVCKALAASAVLLLGVWSANCLRYGESFSLKYLFFFSLREMYGLAAFVPIALYDGTRGRQLPKWFWYGFYPAHILLLYGLSGLIGAS